MISVDFPTSKDIYLEVNGKKLAIVEGYKVHSVKESRYIEAFGESEPISCIDGKVKHYIELSKVYVSNKILKDNISFYNLKDFNLVIVKPGKKIIYSGCEWSEITEVATLNNTVLNGVSLIASKRMELDDF
jgi:hypothetical protein